MKVIYYYDEPPQTFSKSIFLAGPSPRIPEVQSWRPEALRILRERNYDGVVFIPESKPEKNTPHDWSQASQWEHRMLDMADIVLFWVSRDTTLDPRTISELSKKLAHKTEEQIRAYFSNYSPELRLPGHTTDVEFGHWCSSGKAILGQPPRAPHTAYLRFMADKFNVPTLWTLEATIDKALELIDQGAVRTAGEREIPLFLWDTASFQAWYRSQKKTGNRLDGATVKWIFKVGKNKDRVFYWAIHANIHIASENRNKTNEVVISRFDISSVVLYRKRGNILNTEVVLVKEFRSSAQTEDGFIWELPGGSSPTSTDPLQTIADEVREEVGLDIDKSRFQPETSRQMAGTMSAHHGILFSAELTEEELTWLKLQKDIPHGENLDDPTGERTHTEVLNLKEIRERGLADWPNYGMICEIILQRNNE